MTSLAQHGTLTPETTTVIYHGPTCPDGFGAAFAAWLVLGDAATYLPTDYGTAPPDVTGRDVFILDFCYGPQELEAMAQKARSITVLDHHATARDKLQCFCCKGVKLTLNMDKSGARLAWDFFHPGKPVPHMIACLEDRDLWRWQVPESLPYLRHLDTRGFDFKAWAQVLAMESDPAQVEAFVERGFSMQGHYDYLVAEIAAGAFEVDFLGNKVLAVTCSSLFTSEVGNLLAQRSPSGIGMCFSVRVKQGQPALAHVSLRSVGADVRSLCERFGGGGHLCASAFKTPLENLQALLDGTLQPPAPSPAADAPARGIAPAAASPALTLGEQLKANAAKREAAIGAVREAGLAQQRAAHAAEIAVAEAFFEHVKADVVARIAEGHCASELRYPVGGKTAGKRNMYLDFERVLQGFSVLEGIPVRLAPKGLLGKTWADFQAWAQEQGLQAKWEHDHDGCGVYSWWVLAVS